MSMRVMMALLPLLAATYNFSHIRTQLVKHSMRPSVHQHLCQRSTNCRVRQESVGEKESGQTRLQGTTGLLFHGKLESLRSSFCQHFCGWMVVCRSHMTNPIPTQEGTELCTCKCWATVSYQEFWDPMGGKYRLHLISGHWWGGCIHFVHLNPVTVSIHHQWIHFPWEGKSARTPDHGCSRSSQRCKRALAGAFWYSWCWPHSFTLFYKTTSMPGHHT